PPLRLRDRRRARGHRHREGARALRERLRAVPRRHRAVLLVEAGAVHPGRRRRLVRRADPARVPPRGLPSMILAGLPFATLLAVFGAAAAFATALYILKLR